MGNLKLTLLLLMLVGCGSQSSVEQLGELSSPIKATVSNEIAAIAKLPRFEGSQFDTDEIFVTEPNDVERLRAQFSWVRQRRTMTVVRHNQIAQAEWEVLCPAQLGAYRHEDDGFMTVNALVGWSFAKDGTIVSGVVYLPSEDDFMAFEVPAMAALAADLGMDQRPPVPSQWTRAEG